MFYQWLVVMNHSDILFNVDISYLAALTLNQLVVIILAIGNKCQWNLNPNTNISKQDREIGWKISSAKWWQFCLRLNVLRHMYCWIEPKLTLETKFVYYGWPISVPDLCIHFVCTPVAYNYHYIIFVLPYKISISIKIIELPIQYAVRMWWFWLTILAIACSSQTSTQPVKQYWTMS